jgi:hypothetical protein
MAHEMALIKSVVDILSEYLRIQNFSLAFLQLLNDILVYVLPCLIFFLSTSSFNFCALPIFCASTITMSLNSCVYFGFRFPFDIPHVLLQFHNSCSERWQRCVDFNSVLNGTKEVFPCSVTISVSGSRVHFLLWLDSPPFQMQTTN